MLTIGDFSKISHVTITTLRYYDELGLLLPIAIDPDSNYRYYSVSQLPRINRILALQDLGLSLKEIGNMLSDALTIEQLQDILKIKQAELQQHIEQETDRLKRVVSRFKYIEQENAMPNYDIVLKQVDPQLVASIRAIIPAYPDIGQLLGQLTLYAAQHHQYGLATAIWHDNEYKTANIDCEAVIMLKQPIPAMEQITVYDLPAATVASAVHHGAYNRLHEAYTALTTWIEQNGYRIIGSSREIYLECAEPVRQDDETYITEIQFPVAKA